MLTLMINVITIMYNFKLAAAGEWRGVLNKRVLVVLVGEICEHITVPNMNICKLFMRIVHVNNR